MTEKAHTREALFVVVHNPDHLQDVLVGLVEIGITTATILESQGMGNVIGRNLSVFAGFRDLWTGTGGYNHTLFAVIDTGIVDEAVRVIRDILDGFAEKGRGVVFTLPVSRFEALSPRRADPTGA